MPVKRYILHNFLASVNTANTMAPLGPTLFIMQYIGNYVSSEHYTEHYLF